MVFSGIGLEATKTWTNSDVGNVIAYEFNIRQGAGLAFVNLKVSVTPTGSGTFTLDKRAPFGIINRLRVLDENGNQLMLLKSHELVFLHYILTKTNPFDNVLYKDGTNGWIPVASATDVASGEEIVGTLKLPVRLGKARQDSKLRLEITLSDTQTNGWEGVGTFATSSTSISGHFIVQPEYDSDINHTFSTVVLKESVGTEEKSMGEIPEGVLIRYIVHYLDDFWTANDATTDDQWLIDSWHFYRDLETVPIKLDRFTARQFTQDLLDIDPDFVLGDQSSIAYNWFAVALPDFKAGTHTDIKTKNDSTQDTTSVLVIVHPDPAQRQKAKAFSPAVISRFLKG